MAKFALLNQTAVRPWKIGQDSPIGGLPAVTGLVWSILVLVISPSVSALDDVPFEKASFLDLRVDVEEADARGRYLILMFEQEGCVYCEKMRKVNFADSEITGLLKQHFDLVRLDIWGDRTVTDFEGRKVSEKTFAKRNNVQFTPMSVIVGGDGSEIMRMTGYYKPERFKATLTYVVDGLYKKQPFRDNLMALENTAPKSTASKSMQSGDAAAMLKKAAKSGKGLAVLFEKSQCPACVELRETLSQETSGLLAGSYDLLGLDLWGEGETVWLDGRRRTEKEIGEFYEINYTPTLLFFDPSGELVFRFDSYRQPEHFKLVLRYLSTEGYSRFDSFQEWLRHRPH